jgi:hypothetical protein
MESFEITFFCMREKHVKNTDDIIKMEFEKHDVFQKKSIVEFFSDDEKDFVEYRLSIFDLIITENDFIDTLTILSRFVSAVFEKRKDISLATGIYELTDYFTESKQNLIDLQNDFVRNFPIVFLRKGQTFGLGRIIYDDKNLTCVFNENTQSLFGS